MMKEWPKLQLRLVKIKNPWGVGSEWQGDFSDDSKLWDLYPKLKEELQAQYSNNGEWWMTFEDWVKNFSKVYICRLFEAGKWH